MPKSETMVVLTNLNIMDELGTPTKLFHIYIRMSLISYLMKGRFTVVADAKYSVRTLKLQINLVTGTTEEKNDAWTRLRQIDNDTWKAANWIVSGQYFNDLLMRFIYQRRGIDFSKRTETAKVKKEFETTFKKGKKRSELFKKVKLLEKLLSKYYEDEVSHVEEGFEKFFSVKRQATSERDIKKKFPLLPPCVTNVLNQVVFANYRKEKSDLLSGNRTLRTYRKGLPIPTSRNSIQFFIRDGKHMFYWKLSRSEKLTFSIYYGDDRGNYKQTLQNILKNKTDYSASQIKLEKNIYFKKGHISRNIYNLFLFLPVKDPIIKLKLDKKKYVGVHIGVGYPIYISLNSGLQRRELGDNNDFLKLRTQMQNRRRRLQQNLTSAGGGHGRSKKMQALNLLKDKERNYAKSYNHNLSKMIVTFAVKNKASSITVCVSTIKEDKEDKNLKNLSTFELKDMIKYKAKHHDINYADVEFNKEDRICSKCGHENEEKEGDMWSMQKRVFFFCTKCKFRRKVGFNIATNIAKSITIK